MADILTGMEMVSVANNSMTTSLIRMTVTLDDPERQALKRHLRRAAARYTIMR